MVIIYHDCTVLFPENDINNTILFYNNNQSINMTEEEDTNLYQTEDCIHYVKEWLKLDDDLKSHSEKMKHIRQRQKEISHFIIHYMNQKGLEHLTFDGGRIECNVAKSKPALSKKKLNSSVLEYFNNDEQKAQELLDFIMEKREVKETTKLKRFIEG